MTIERIRFHLDEGVNPNIAVALRRHGVDVTTTVEAGLRTRSDPAHWTHAQCQTRVIVTHDADFLRLARRDFNHAGIAYCTPKKRTLGAIVRRLINTYDEKMPEQMMGQVVYL